MNITNHIYLGAEAAMSMALAGGVARTGVKRLFIVFCAPLLLVVLCTDDTTYFKDGQVNAIQVYPGGSIENCLEGAFTKCLKITGQSLSMILADAAKRVRQSSIRPPAISLITKSALLRTARCSHSLRSSKPAGDSRSQSATIFARSCRDLANFPDQSDRRISRPGGVVGPKLENAAEIWR